MTVHIKSLSELKRGQEAKERKGKERERKGGVSLYDEKQLSLNTVLLTTPPHRIMGQCMVWKGTQTYTSRTFTVSLACGYALEKDVY